MVKSAVRALHILKLVGHSGDGLKHAEISQSLHIPKGSLSQLLSDLVAEDFLYRDEMERRYKIGPQMLALAGRYLGGFDVVRLGQPVLKSLTAMTRESSGLMIRSGMDVLVVGKETSPQPFKWELDIGSRLPMYATAAGKAILAYLDDGEIEQFLSSVPLAPVTANTITDEDRLMRDLAKVRNAAMAYADEEHYEGMAAIAAPVFENNRRVVASIVQHMPLVRYTAEKKTLIEQSIKTAAENLSRKLGCL